MLADTNRSARSVIEAFRSTKVNILVQEFIKEAGGTDIRALVVGGKVIAAMKRNGAADDFSSNLHLGGSAEMIKSTPKERSTAVRAAKSMGLNVCGVDMLRANDGPVVMEVNSSPGLQGIENATGIDVAGKIIELFYYPGKFLNANLDKASDENERQLCVVKTDEGTEIVFVQIAGLIARRIICDLKEGQEVKTGERFGLIRFGSRTDIYLPEKTHVSVGVGQVMVGGETVLANLKGRTKMTFEEE